MSRAKAEILDQIHTLLAQDMLNVLQSGDADPRHWAAIIKFLKDNNIDALVSENEDAEGAFAKLIARAQESISQVQ